MKGCYFILVLSFLSVLSSCEKGYDAMPIDNISYITFVNKQSQNLLVPPSFITENDIRLYYAFNGVTSPSIIPKGFTKETEYLRVLLNVTSKEKYPVTILKIGNYEPDTLTCEIGETWPYFHIAKIWHNSKLIFDVTRDRNGQKFTIVK